jgi:hypothetical protein
MARRAEDGGADRLAAALQPSRFPEFLRGISGLGFAAMVLNGPAMVHARGFALPKRSVRVACERNFSRLLLRTMGSLKVSRQRLALADRPKRVEPVGAFGPSDYGRRHSERDEILIELSGRLLTRAYDDRVDAERPFGSVD